MHRAKTSDNIPPSLQEKPRNYNCISLFTWTSIDMQKYLEVQQHCSSGQNNQQCSTRISLQQQNTGVAARVNVVDPIQKESRVLSSTAFSTCLSCEFDDVGPSSRGKANASGGQRLHMKRATNPSVDAFRPCYLHKFEIQRSQFQPLIIIF